MNHEKRIGNFTSSEIWKLMTSDRSGKGFGAPALSYIAEKNNERRLGRRLTDETNAKPTSWGKLCEKYVNEKLLGTDYEILNDVTFKHPTIDCWVGSPDTIRHNSDGSKVVGDTKAPYTLSSFCGLVNPVYCGNIEEEGELLMYQLRNGFVDNLGNSHPAHKDAEKYYWQLVSNAILMNTDYAELIIFMPYESEIKALKDLADGNPDLYWMMYSELSSIKDGGFYKNITKIEFEVHQSDKDFLTERVLMAEKFLIK